MPKFEVEIQRVSYQYHTVIIEADNEDQACNIAEEKSGDYEYKEKNAEYEIESVNEVQ